MFVVLCIPGGGDQTFASLAVARSHDESGHVYLPMDMLNPRAPHRPCPYQMGDRPRALPPAQGMDAP